MLLRDCGWLRIWIYENLTIGLLDSVEELVNKFPNFLMDVGVVANGIQLLLLLKFDNCLLYLHHYYGCI